MKLAHLLENIAHTDAQLTVSGLTLDSRHVEYGDVFIALNGALQHGLRHADNAITRGAVAIIYDPDGLESSDLPNLPVPMIAVHNLAQQLGTLASRFFSHPSHLLTMIGITGTNGKTTCSQLLAQILPDCGVIGTLGWGNLGQLQPTVNTTPDALALHQMLHSFVLQNKTSVVMEVSSHGLEQGRVNGILFTGAVFTNLSRDHLDYHGTMEDYLQAKLTLFKNPGLRFAVVNIDDENSPQVLHTLAPHVKRWTFSIHGKVVANANSLTADNIIHDSNGIAFDVHWNGRTLRSYTTISGAFNLQNVMTVLCVLLALDWSFEDAIAALSKLQPVTGRLEKYGGQDKPTVYVDYAHTPDALEKVLKSVHGEGQLWAVFGCGGDRDKGKRPEMGRIAEACADHVIITDDNPRTEDPKRITAEILEGCHSDKVRVINDRKQAIEYAIRHAHAKDRIVIAGKGHENYQEAHGVKIPFSDQEVVVEALDCWSASP